MGTIQIPNTAWALLLIKALLDACVYHQFFINQVIAFLTVTFTMLLNRSSDSEWWSDSYERLSSDSDSHQTRMRLWMMISNLFAIKSRELIVLDSLWSQLNTWAQPVAVKTTPWLTLRTYNTVVSCITIHRNNRYLDNYSGTSILLITV